MALTFSEETFLLQDADIFFDLSIEESDFTDEEVMCGISVLFHIVTCTDVDQELILVHDPARHVHGSCQRDQNFGIFFQSLLSLNAVS